MAASPLTDRDLAEVLLALLGQANEPLPVTKLIQQAPRSFKKHTTRCETLLEKFAAQGQAHRFPPFRSKKPRYWTQDARHYARVIIVDLLTGKGPCKPSEVALAIKSRIKGWPSEDLTALVKELVGHKTIRELPPLGRTKLKRLSLKPPKPREYLEKLFAQSLVKPLSKTISLLHQEGVEPILLFNQTNILWRETVAQLAAFATLETALEEKGHERDSLLSHSISDSAQSNNAIAHAPPLPSAEAILKAIRTLKPNAAGGAMVPLPDLRHFLREDFSTKDAFDRVVLQLGEHGLVDLHRHTFPANLTDSEREDLVRDEQGNYFIGLVLRS